MPKSNMYQSLHTTVRRPEGRAARDPDPHARDAPHRGVRHRRALALQGGRTSRTTELDADLAWLGQMMEWLKDMADPREFMEGLRIDLSGGQVFVFTPQGRRDEPAAGRDPGRLRLHDPHRGRAPHDRRQGERQARAARLRAADRRLGRDPHVEGAGRGPDPGLAAVRRRRRARATRSASGSRAERREDALDQGRDLLQRQMRKQNLPFKRLATDERAGAGRRRPASIPDLDALYVAVGEGHVSPQSVVARLARLVQRSRGRRHRRVPLARPVRIARPDTSRRASWSRACPTSGSSSARCCTPVPGDEIVGFVTRGQGVSVHRADCPNVEDPAPRARADDRGVVVRRQADDVRRRDPGRGARPDPAALGHRDGAVRPAREHPVGELDDRAATGSRAAVHVRARRHHAPVVDPRRGASGSTASTTRTGWSRASAGRAPAGLAAPRCAVDGARSSPRSARVPAAPGRRGPRRRRGRGRAAGRARSSGLRIFRDDDGKTNRVARRRRRRGARRARSSRCSPTRERDGGRRSTRAAPPEARPSRSRPFAAALEAHGVQRRRGVFRRRDGGRPRERRPVHAAARHAAAPWRRTRLAGSMTPHVPGRLRPQPVRDELLAAGGRGHRRGGRRRPGVRAGRGPRGARRRRASGRSPSC